MATLVEEDIWADEEDIDDDLLMSVHLFGESVVKNGHLPSQNGSVAIASTSKDHLNGFASTSKDYANGFAHTSRPGVTPISTLASLGTRLSTGDDSSKENGKKAKIDIVQANRGKRKVTRVYRRNVKPHPQEEIPLYRIKYGRLFVTDVTSQFWCELQLEYKYEPPLAMIRVEVVPAPEVTTGKSLHLVRELQVEVPVVVPVTSAEDRFALKVLSLLDGILSLVNCGTSIRREIHIFGEPFGMGIYVNGIIDEIRCHQETLELEIVEFKTRRSNCLPTDAQKLTHDLQVMLYKQLFDEMVSGKFSKATLASHFRLDLNKKLGKGFMDAVLHKQADTLSKLLDLLFETMKGVPFVSRLLIEYMFQEDRSTIAFTPVEFDEEWLEGKLRHALSYWKGERLAEGVPIEECWKCQRCPYKDSCTWRAGLVQQYSQEVVEGATPPQELPVRTEEVAIPENDSDVIVLQPTPEPVREFVLVDLTVENVIL